MRAITRQEESHRLMEEARERANASFALLGEETPEAARERTQATRDITREMAEWDRTEARRMRETKKEKARRERRQEDNRAYDYALDQATKNAVADVGLRIQKEADLRRQLQKSQRPPLPYHVRREP